MNERRSTGILQGRREQIAWPRDRRFRILSIDGGGIRGLLPASVLAQLESRYLNGGKIGDHFDLIAGTSTGGIIALGLAFGLEAQSIVDLYADHGSEIFPPRPPISGMPLTGLMQKATRSLRGMTRYQYDRAPLETLLRAAFGERVLGESTRRLAIPSFDGYGEVNVFKTPHHKDYQKDWSEKAVDIALATSAAPTFFSTFRNGTRQFADGGVWANNPIMIALVDALACYDVDRSQIDILSLGCADGEYKITADQELKGGIWHWREIMSAAMHLQGQNAWGQAGLLIGRDRIVRIDQIPAAAAIPIDDHARCLAELPEIARRLVDQKGNDVARIFLSEQAGPFPALRGPRLVGPSLPQPA
ncbi:MAG: CBASS cGAMP-activated phospholipase [Devosia sp.]